MAVVKINCSSIFQLFIKVTPVGKKLLQCLLVLVWRTLRCLPDGSSSKRLCAG